MYWVARITLLGCLLGNILIPIRPAVATVDDEQIAKLTSYNGKPFQETHATNEDATNGLKFYAIDYADLVEKLLPSVVNISTIYRVKKGKEISEMLFNNLPSNSLPKEFQESFADLFKEEVDSGIEVKSLGSGFVWDKDGYIVTNAHVIQNADEIIVSINDTTKLRAELIGSDLRSDLALLKIRTNRKLSPVTFGNSNGVRVGNPVVVVGNPFGLGASVSAGIISAIGRDLQGDTGGNHYDNFFQTDAAINEGNSGGPLFNMQGEVIGVNTAILSPTGANVGIGFAIPSNMVVSIIKQLKADGKVTRGWLGLTIQNIDEELASTLKLSNVVGALVVSVDENSPANQAGINVGDVILKYNNLTVGSAYNSLAQLVTDTPIGSEAKLLLYSQGKQHSVRVKIEQLVDEQPENSADDVELSGKYIAALRLRLTAISQELARREGLYETEGLWITAVDSGSEAKEKGIHRGDIITTLNQEKVDTVNALEDKIAYLTKQKQKTVLVFIKRKERTYPIVLNINKSMRKR